MPTAVSSHLVDVHAILSCILVTKPSSSGCSVSCVWWHAVITEIHMTTLWHDEIRPKFTPLCSRRGGACTSCEMHAHALSSESTSYRSISLLSIPRKVFFIARVQLVGGIAQWLGRRSLVGGLFLIYGWHVTTSWVRCPIWVNQPGHLSLHPFGLHGLQGWCPLIGRLGWHVVGWS